MKQLRLLLFLLFIIVFTSTCCYAQNAGYGKIYLTPPAIINFKALADSQLLHPMSKAKRFIEQAEDKFEDFKYKPRGIRPGQRVTQISGGGNLRSVNSSSPPVLSFPAVQDYGVLIPPDIQGVAGTTYLMETTNQEFDVYTKTGTLSAALALTNFFSATLGTHFFDPHVLYDVAHGRYIICSDGTYKNGNGGLFVGVSVTNDPTGNWYIYSFDAAGSSGHFIDYPEMGFNNKWVVLTANDFVGTDTVNARIYVMRSDSLYQGNLGAVTFITDTGSYSVVPAQTNDTLQDTVFLVHDANGDYQGNGYMQLGTISGPVDGPIYDFGNSIGVNQPWGEDIVDADQDGGDNTIEDGDTRVMNGVVYSNHSLWFTHNVFLPADTPTHTGVDWWQIDPATLTVQQFGRLEDTDANTFYFYPSLGVNTHNDMVLGYCISSNSYYPSAGYSMRFAGDAANTLRNTYIYKYGMGSYDKTFGGGRNRWGDFTGTVADPVDGTFWNFNEYSGITNSWATAIAHIADSITGCKTAASFIYSTGLSCGAPFSVSFTNLSTSASSSYWDFGDGAVSGILNPSHTYNNPGIYSVDLVTTDPICGVDSMFQPNIIYITDEDPVTTGQSVCAGQSATLTATGPGIIYWYGSTTGNALLDTGSIFNTPFVRDTTIFYAASYMPGPITNCGPVDNNFGTGSYAGTTRQHLVVFDCKFPQKLLSVDVYAFAAGNCKIALLSPDNVVLGLVNPYLNAGLNTVNLNFDIPIDHDLKLTTQDSVNLYRNSSGATYPYYSTDSTLILIHSDQVTTTDYFYFYNWKMQTGCISNRIAAVVSVINPDTSFDYENVSGNKISFVPANGNVSSCHWLFGDGTTSEQSLTTHTYSAPGIYPVQLIEQVEGCTDTIFEPVAVDTGGAFNLKEINSMFIFPDPVQNQLNVQVGLKQNSDGWQLRIVDVLGQTVITRNLQLNAGVNILPVDVSILPVGPYYVSLRNGKAIATRRFIKDN